MSSFFLLLLRRMMSTTRFAFLLWNIFFVSIDIHVESRCQLQNRTMILTICKTPPRIIVPVCVGFCSSSSQWNVHFHQFIPRIHTCQVTKYRRKLFICPDSTHTAIYLFIPLTCSCTKRHCFHVNQTLF